MTAFSIKTEMQQRFTLAFAANEAVKLPVFSCFSPVQTEDLISIPIRYFVNGIYFFVRIPAEECRCYLINESRKFYDLVISVGSRIRSAVRKTTSLFRRLSDVFHGKKLFCKLMIFRL